MTDATEGKTGRLTGPDDVIGYFLKPNSENLMGVELEVSILAKTPDGGLRPINNAENKELQDILAHPGENGFAFAPVKTSEEAGTFTLEVKSDAVNYENIETILVDLERQMDALREVSLRKGYLLSAFAQVAGPTVDELLVSSVIDRPRAHVFMETFQSHGFKDYCRNFLLNNSTQISVSFRDPADLFRNALRLVVLTAPLSTAHDNSSGLLEGRKDPQQTGLRLREDLAKGGRGGSLTEVFTRASDTQSLARNYLDHALDTPLLALYDENGKNLAPTPPGSQITFRKLITQEAGLNSLTNFDLAFGMQWPHVKLAFIRKDGEITGARIEARACDMGPWQYASFPLIVAALCCNERLAVQTDALLKSFGFDLDDPPSLRLQPAIDAALDYRDEFGTGKRTDFLVAFGELVKDSYAAKPSLLARLRPFLDICENRRTPGLEARLAL